MTATTELRPALAHLLDGRSITTANELTALIHDKITWVRDGKIELDWVRHSVLANGAVLSHLVAHPEDLSGAEPPVGAVSLVRELARGGMPFSDIIRAYQMCASRWLQMCLRDLAVLTEDSEPFMAQSIELSEIVTGYLDVVCQRILVVYEQERDHWRGQEESLRLERVLALLGDGGVSGSEFVLDYPLRQRHLGLIVWTDASHPTAGDVADARVAAVTAAADLGGGGEPLIVVRDARTVWAWIRQPAAQTDAVEVLERIALQAGPHVRFAVGGAGVGAEGFIASHRQAAIAHEVGRATVGGPTVFPYRAVSSLAFLCSDIDRARSWVAETLGPLATDAPKPNELRHTLAAYLQANRSATATARLLHCHKNTVLYRVGIIESLLGEGIAPLHRDLDLALHACRWLGAAVLGQDTASATRV